MLDDFERYITGYAVLTVDGKTPSKTDRMSMRKCKEEDKKYLEFNEEDATATEITVFMNNWEKLVCID